MIDGQERLQTASTAPFRIALAIWNGLNTAFIGVAVGLVIAAAGFIVVPKALGWTGVVVLSGSMEPELRTGGVAFIDEIDTKTLEVGDIITYRPFTDQSNMVTHRIVEVQSTTGGLFFVTKGDANTDPDRTPIAANYVVGEVQYHVPFVGYAIDRLNNQDSYYLIVGIPAALLILNEIAGLYTEFRKSRRRAAALPEAEGASS